MVYRGHGASILIDFVFRHEPGAVAVDLLEGLHSQQKRSQPLAERDRWMVPNLHLHAIGAALDVPTQEQADYSCVKFEGPFKATLVA